MEILKTSQAIKHIAPTRPSPVGQICNLLYRRIAFGKGAGGACVLASRFVRNLDQTWNWLCGLCVFAKEPFEFLV